MLFMYLIDVASVSQLCYLPFYHYYMGCCEDCLTCDICLQCDYVSKSPAPRASTPPPPLPPLATGATAGRHRRHGRHLALGPLPPRRPRRPLPRRNRHRLLASPAACLTGAQVRPASPRPLPPSTPATSTPAGQPRLPRSMNSAPDLRSEI